MEFFVTNLSHQALDTNIMIFAAAAMSLLLTLGLTSFGLVGATTQKKNPKPPPAKKESPKRKDLSKIRFSEEDMKQKRKPAYYLKIVKLQPDYELIFIDSTPGTDGYGQKLYDHIKNNDGFRDEGVLLVVRRRISQNDNNVLTNIRDNYPRRAIVRLVDNSTRESRLAILSAFKTFLSLPENNKFGYDYVVNDTSDLTPSNSEDLEPMDYYVQDDTILNIINIVYEDTDQSWYHKNRDSALTFFSGPTFPQWAVEKLGYPLEGITRGGYAAGFNVAAEGNV
jgi:hypothetical protein